MADNRSRFSNSSKAYGLLLEGNIAEASKWIGYAAQQLKGVLARQPAPTTLLLKPQSGVDIRIDARPNKISIKVGNPHYFIWLPSGLSTGTNGLYASKPVPTPYGVNDPYFGWYAQPVDSYSFAPLATAEKYRLPAATSFFNVDGNLSNAEWPAPHSWSASDGSSHVIVTPIAFKDATEAAHYQSTGNYPATGATNSLRPYLALIVPPIPGEDPVAPVPDENLTWAFASTSVKALCAIYAGKQYILSSGSALLQSIAYAVTVVDGTLVLLVHGTTLYVHALVPCANGDIYGTTTVTTYTLPSDSNYAPLCWVFSDINPKVLYCIGVDNTLVNVPGKIALLRYDLSDVSAVPAPSRLATTGYVDASYVHSLRCVNGVVSAVVLCYADVGSRADYVGDTLVESRWLEPGYGTMVYSGGVLTESTFALTGANLPFANADGTRKTWENPDIDYEYRTTLPLYMDGNKKVKANVYSKLTTHVEPNPGNPAFYSVVIDSSVEEFDVHINNVIKYSSAVTPQVNLADYSRTPSFSGVASAAGSIAVSADRVVISMARIPVSSWPYYLLDINTATGEVTEMPLAAADKVTQVFMI